MLVNKQKVCLVFSSSSRHENFDEKLLSHPCFEQPLLFGDKTNLIIFKQTAKTVQKLFNGIAGFDVSFEGYKLFFKEAWKENYSYLKFSRLVDKEKFCFCYETKKEFRTFKTVTDSFWKNSSVCTRKHSGMISFC